MLTNWLEQHGFICVKDYDTSLVYQKINKDDILEIEVSNNEIINVEYYSNVGKSEENIYDSISLNNHK